MFLEKGRDSLIATVGNAIKLWQHIDRQILKGLPKTRLKLAKFGPAQVYYLFCQASQPDGLGRLAHFLRFVGDVADNFAVLSC